MAYIYTLAPLPSSIADDRASAGSNFSAATSGLLASIQSTQSDGPKKRTGHGLAVAEGCLFVVGGNSGTDQLTDVWKFDLRKRQWAKIDVPNPYASQSGASGASQSGAPAAVFEGREGHTANFWAESLIVFGGTVGRKSSNEVWGLQGGKWRLLSANDKSAHVPSARDLHAAVAWNSHLWIHGGWGESEVLGDFWNFDLKRKKWKFLGTPIGRRYRHSMSLCLDGTCLVAGGRNERLLFLHDVSELDLTTGACTRVGLGDFSSGLSLVPLRFVVRDSHSSGKEAVADVLILRGARAGVTPWMIRQRRAEGCAAAHDGLWRFLENFADLRRHVSEYLLPLRLD